jgi:hypothetical protein
MAVTTRQRSRVHRPALSMSLWMIGVATSVAIAGHPAVQLPDGTVAAEQGCLFCHGNIEEIWAPMLPGLGCVFCHGGDGASFDKDTAHVQPALPPIMDKTVAPLDYDLPYQQFVNPTNLRVVDNTCGRCHVVEAEHVKKSMMSTTAGHYAGGLYQNGVVDTKTPIYGTFATQDLDGVVPTEAGAVASLLDLLTYDPSADPSLVSTHYAAVPGQVCARCHLWSRGKGYRGAVGQEGLYRADGCAACHMLYANDGLSRSADASIDHTQPGHPMTHEITRAIPTDQCLHCHHRGARIGLSFTGRAQMPPDLPSGPGVPGTTDQKFNGNYHMTDPVSNPPSIHGERGMHCIDCHTKDDIMGDGNIYGHMDQATNIKCRTCHGTPSQTATLIDKKGKRLINTTLYVEGWPSLTSKVDSQKHIIPQVKDLTDPTSPLFNRKAACAMNDNHIKEEGGLECAACHTSWTPNCFGCHFQRDERLQGLNLVTRQYETGKASTNNKVFESFKHFFMGPNAAGKMSPYIVGCQTISDVTAPDGSKILDFVMPETVNGLSGLALDPVNPHTIRGKGEVRACVECHRSPPSLGLGSGSYSLARDLAFSASADGVKVYDRRANPVDPPLLTTIAMAAPTAIASVPDIIQGTTDYLVVAAGVAGVSIFDMRGNVPVSPVTQITGINALDVSRVARYLYVVNAGEGVRIYDNIVPSAVSLVTTIPIPNALRAVPWGIHLFVPAGDDGLYIVNIADHNAPAIVGHMTGMNARDVHLYAHFQMARDFAMRAYVADPSAGVHVLDLLPDYDSPLLVTTLPLVGASAIDTYTRYVAAHDDVPSREHDYLYVAAGSAGLYVYDITVPNAIVQVGSVTDLGGEATDVDVASQINPPGVDDYAWVANATLGLQVVDVTDPTSPVKVNASTASGVSRVFVEVQQLDRFIDEQGNLLKENSHPGAGHLDRAGIVRILSVAITPPPCDVSDLDGDIDSDLADYWRVNRCLGGPTGGLLSGCNHADSNGDLDVDLQDVATFQNGFTGP